MMTPIGGAAGTVMMGMAADYRDMTFSFLVPLSAFAVILAYAAAVLRRK
jgi:FHS family L-fucose permease-like MFS transporter